MAFNQLKKWVGTQLWSTFMTEYNENIDELNRVIDGVNEIVESGSNSRGEWIKWADGTMICYHSKSVSDFTLQYTLVDNIGFNYYSWEYPHQFYGTPHVAVGRAQIGTGAQWGSSRQNTSAVAQLVVWGARGNTGILDITMQAIGRWKA